MTDTAPHDAAPVLPPESRADDRTLPAVAYGLYLLGFATGITAVVGLVVAYANRDTAGPVARSHYDFLIRTFWMLFGWALIASALFGVGLLFSLILVGIPVVGASLLIFSALGLWYAVRCVLGIIYLARGEAYPRPRNWLF